MNINVNKMQSGDWIAETIFNGILHNGIHKNRVKAIRLCIEAVLESKL